MCSTMLGRVFKNLCLVLGVGLPFLGMGTQALIQTNNLKDEKTSSSKIRSDKFNDVSTKVSVVNKDKDLSKKEEKEIKMETTLIILKPDCMEKGLQGEVIRRFNEQKFEIIGCKMMALSEALLKEHYSHLTHLPFFPEIVAFMQSHPVMILALKGEGIIEKMRNLLGPTDSTIAPKGTIRGDFGTDKMRNIAHASDSEENAKKEIARFFKTGELFE